MNLHDFSYDLPQELIAQDPLEDRSSSRLMLLDKNTGAIEHKVFKDIIDYLNPGDCLNRERRQDLETGLYSARESLPLRYLMWLRMETGL